MSSGYSSLEEDSEEYFFTARTSFFKKPQGKLTDRKVNNPFHELSLLLDVKISRPCSFSAANVNSRHQTVSDVSPLCH